MAIFSKHLFVYCKYDASIANNVISDLVKNGYEPLISKTREMVFSLWGRPDQKDTGFTLTWQGPSTSNRPLAGDLFFPAGGKGVFYVALYGSDDIFKRPRLQLGAIGDSSLSVDFQKFSSVVKRSLPNRGKRKWSIYGLMSSRIANFSEQGVRFLRASEISSRDFENSKVLEDATVRALALRIKASGGLLEIDIKRSVGTDETEMKLAALRDLTKMKLLDLEYVVICRRSSNQICRIQNPEQLEQMNAMGTLCSCGAPIAKERVEEFIRPSGDLIKLLNGSFWMSAKLVTALTTAGVMRERILLGVHEGSEEIDALADFNANVLMFELKDGQFSMKHAYSFGARLGIYKPQYGIIFATSGVAPEVKTHFERIKPDSEILYIETFDHLEAKVAEILDRLRSEAAMKLLFGFEPLFRFDMPLARTIGRRIGLDDDAVSSASGVEPMNWNSGVWRR